MSFSTLALAMILKETTAADALRHLLDNGVLAWGLAACGIAQLFKVGVELLMHRRWRPGVLFETGGMPSSHSALMSGISSAIGWQLGFADPLFALAGSLAAKGIVR